MKEVMPNFPKGSAWSVTSEGVHSNPKAFNHVMKADTRVEGPWKKDESVQKSCSHDSGGGSPGPGGRQKWSDKTAWNALA